MTATRKTGAGGDKQPFRTRARQMEKRPPCQAECPNSGNIRGWLGIIAQRDKHGLSLEQAYDLAWEELVRLNPFPAAIGRICPHPCELNCTRAGKDGAVSINALERFLGDWGIERNLALPVPATERHAESIGVIGSGPAGLSFAYQMARRGYAVTVYEKSAQPGGMLRHAIPDYRLPASVLDAEIQRLFDMNVTLEMGVEPGMDVALDELRRRHRLLFLGMGAQGARRLGIPGESGPGVFSGVAYLRCRKEGVETGLGQRVIVVGGGNTAIDSARSARREGAAVTVLYRRTREEMPAASHEVEDAITEGVQFTCLAAPCKILRDDMVVTGLEFQRMRPGEPDEGGRRRPVPVDGEFHCLPADSIIVAVSQQPDWQSLHAAGDGEKWLLTRQDGKLADDIWAGGDDTGPGIASRAIAQGRLAAESAHAQLRGEPAPRSLPQPPLMDISKVKTDYYQCRTRVDLPRRLPEHWLQRPDQEIDQTISSDQAREEAARCMSCGLCFDCYQCVMYCNPGGFSRLEGSSPGHYYALDLDACEGCGKCIELCPSGYLEAREGSPWGTD